MKIKGVGRLVLGVFLVGLSGISEALSANQSGTAFVIVNNTGLPDDAVYVSFSAQTSIQGVYGTYDDSSTQLIQANTLYSLAELYGTLSGASTGGPTGTVSTFNIWEMASGGLISFSLGRGVGNGAAPYYGFDTVNTRVEASVQGAGTQSNIDISYVDGVSMPADLYVKYRADGTTVQSGGQTLQNTATSGPTIFNALTASTSVTPYVARVETDNPSNPNSISRYDVVNDQGHIVGQMGGILGVIAPQINASGYHSWTDPGMLIPTLQANGTTLALQNFRTPVGAPVGSVKPGVEFGFSVVSPGSTPGEGATLPQSPFNPNNIPNLTTVYSETAPTNGIFDPNNTFLNGGDPGNSTIQSYNFTATFLANLNPGSDELLTQAGITDGTSGVKISGIAGLTGGTEQAGAFDIYMTTAQLGVLTAIYGSNPQYVVDWSGATINDDGGIGRAVVLTYNTNNIADRIIGDMNAGMNMGWAGSDSWANSDATTIAEYAVDSGTAADLAGSVFDPSATIPSGFEYLGDKKVGELTSGEFFYLLSLMTSTENLQKWFGSSLQPDQPEFYNTYGNAFAVDTTSYTLAFSDRLQGNITPDLFYNPNGDQSVLDSQYIEIVLNPGSYVFYPVPEPSSALLLLLGGGAAFWIARRKKAMLVR